MKKRTKAGKKAWRTRIREKAWKGTCAYCHKRVWVRGRKHNGRWYHTRCLRFKAVGLPPELA